VVFFVCGFFFLINIAKPGSTSTKESIFTQLEAPFTYAVRLLILKLTPLIRTMRTQVH